MSGIFPVFFVTGISKNFDHNVSLSVEFKLSACLHSGRYSDNFLFCTESNHNFNYFGVTKFYEYYNLIRYVNKNSQVSSHIGQSVISLDFFVTRTKRVAVIWWRPPLITSNPLMMQPEKLSERVHHSKWQNFYHKRIRKDINPWLI